jgi:imidazole glycerol phosphate synthase glutamine amidotransferase subunit
MIGIVDYGAGNLHSVGKALDFLGVEFRVLSDPQAADSAERLILPGVGAFGAAVRCLERGGWMERIREWAAADRPLLGICLGMQLFFESSKESNNYKGLGIMPGTCLRLSAPKVPQIGWNRVNAVRPHPLLDSISGGAFFYFVHAYYVEPEGDGSVVAETRYGADYPSMVAEGRVVGVQFHPEKSGRDGLKLLRNWVERC